METTSCQADQEAIHSNLGTFEGFNFRNRSAIITSLTASDVVNWDHDRKGQAEFWPSGDRPEVALLFKGENAITSSELLDLDRLLCQLGGDSPENFLRIHYVVNICGARIGELTSTDVEDRNISLFFGTSFMDLRRSTALELFELYHSDEYRVWEMSTCDGLIVDEDRFLDSPSFFVEEIVLGDQKALLVAPQ